MGSKSRAADGKIGKQASTASRAALSLPAFNVTVRSDRHGTCQGSHVAQACVGHCESSAFPSRFSVLVASGYRHNITSASQCCTISSLKKVRGLCLMGHEDGDPGTLHLMGCEGGDPGWEGMGTNLGPPPTGEGVAAVRGEPAWGA